MLSCDNFALTALYSGVGTNLHAKNSDRPLGEAQALRFYPAADYPEGATVKCTDLTIPQVSHTYALIGSQPYWIWGFEMGVNECGVSIGNEAQGSRCAAETQTGLLGMDILRLALERSATAREAVCVITALLEQYGQNANASQLFDRRYENSYLIMDRSEILVLETAGRQWVMKKVIDWTAISNCYSIGTDFDAASENLVKLACDKRWFGGNQKFHFAKAYTLPADRQKNSVPRWRRMCAMLEASEKPVSLNRVKTICRDHFDGQINEPRFGGFLGTFYSVCMHAETTLGSQTVASMITYYDEVLGIVCRHALALPCCSAYMPVYFGNKLPDAIERVGEKYDSESLWWAMERLAMAVSVDEERFGPAVRGELSALESALEEKAQKTEAQAKSLVLEGKNEMAAKMLQALTQEAADLLMDLSGMLTQKICTVVRSEGGAYGPRREFLLEYSARVDMPLFD